MFRVLHSDYFGDTYPEEHAAMQQCLQPEQLIRDPHEVEAGDVVLPRYRSVPFGELLEDEVVQHGGRLINTAAQSSKVRDLYSWVNLLPNHTAPAYRIEDMDNVPEDRFFVKGQTSSLKYLGPSAVFAESKADAVEMAMGLRVHDWLSSEEPVIRPVQNYRLLGRTKTGLPMFNERRAFTYRGQLLSEGFYWTGQGPELEVAPDQSLYHCIETVMDLVKHVADFLVIDFAQYEDGHWGVIELNDGCQAGFAGASELEVYSKLNLFCA